MVINGGFPNTYVDMIDLRLLTSGLHIWHPEKGNAVFNLSQHNDKHCLYVMADTGASLLSNVLQLAYNVKFNVSYQALSCFWHNILAQY